MVKTLGALGDRYVYIAPGDRLAPPLKEDAYLVAESADDFLDKLAKSGNQLSAVSDVINELLVLLKNINQDGRSSRIAENLAVTSADLKRITADLRVALASPGAGGASQNRLQEVLVHLQSILLKIDRGEGTLGALINDPTLHQKLVSLVGESPRRAYLKPLIRETIQHQEQKGTPR
jgi:phospholipid/cholesterol/gamma-HCH transport system substrate-binding protein